MNAKNVLGIVFSSAYDDNVREMTGIRTMGSIPFAGRYRLIDFVLSNMVNCGISKVGIITKSNYQSLMDHLGSGKAWDLSRKNEGMTILPPFNLGGGIYRSKVEALSNTMTYISQSNKDYVVLSDCNVVCNIDYSKLFDFHESKGADITIACKMGAVPDTEDRMVFSVEGEGRINEITVSPSSKDEAMYSLNIIVISRVLLERLINDAVSANLDSLEKDIFQANVNNLKIYGYEVTEFAKTIDSLKSYYSISMSLVNGGYKDLFNRERPVYTKVRDYMPATYGLSSDVKNSLVADGCIIKGKVENSIIFRGVTVDEGAEVKNSIVMQGAYIGANAKLNCAILDKSVFLKPGRELSGADTYPIYVGKEIIV